MDQYFTGVEIDTIKKQEIAPELCPAINQPTEVQDLRKIDKAEKVDIQEWIETAVEVLPEISIEIQKLNEEMAPANIDHQQTQLPGQQSMLFKSQVKADTLVENSCILENSNIVPEEQILKNS